MKFDNKAGYDDINRLCPTQQNKQHKSNIRRRLVLICRLPIQKNTSAQVEKTDGKPCHVNQETKGINKSETK